MFATCRACVVQFVKREDGPTAVEYAVMLGLVIAVVFIAIATLGQTVSGDFANPSLQSAVHSGSSS
jgi:pilus assembly protein Flp/PilA